MAEVMAVARVAGTATVVRAVAKGAAMAVTKGAARVVARVAAVMAEARVAGTAGVARVAVAREAAARAVAMVAVARVDHTGRRSHIPGYRRQSLGAPRCMCLTTVTGEHRGRRHVH